MPNTENPSMEEIMAEQLSSLYAEKELLEKELGLSDAEDIVMMVRSLVQQLEVLYQDGEHA